MKKLILVTLVLVPLVAGSQPPPSGEEADSISMIQLIANPGKYEGRLIQLVGVAHFGQEEAALYLHREDRELLNTTNAVWVGGKAGFTRKDYESLSGAFVIVEGRFTAKEHGHLGAYPGALESVRRLEKKRTRTDYENMRKPSPK
jgi:hypothetical protein